MTSIKTNISTSYAQICLSCASRTQPRSNWRHSRENSRSSSLASSIITQLSRLLSAIDSMESSLRISYRITHPNGFSSRRQRIKKISPFWSLTCSFVLATTITSSSSATTTNPNNFANLTKFQPPTSEWQFRTIILDHHYWNLAPIAYNM